MIFLVVLMFATWMLARRANSSDTVRDLLPIKPVQPERLSSIVFSFCTTVETLSSELPIMRTWVNNSIRGLMWLDHEPETELQHELEDIGMPWRISPIHPSLARSGASLGLPDEYKWRQTRCALQPVMMASADEFRWLVLVEADTIVNIDNLLAVLGHFDPNQSTYIMGLSEVVEEPRASMAFRGGGGGGIPLSSMLVKRLADTMEPCLERELQIDDLTYDQAIHRCVLELGVSRKHDPFTKGFNQLDLSGNIEGFLEAMPRVPVVTLYGLQRFELLRGLRTEEALTLMSKAMHDHPSAFLQQTLCRGPGYTLAIANGYSVRLWDYEVTAIDLSIKEMTFTSATKDNEVPPFTPPPMLSSDDAPPSAYWEERCSPSPIYIAISQLHTLLNIMSVLSSKPCPLRPRPVSFLVLVTSITGVGPILPRASSEGAHPESSLHCRGNVQVTVDTFDGDIRETGTLSSKCAVFYVSDTATRAGDLKVLKYSRVSGGLRGEPGVHPGLQELEVLQPELKDRWLYPNSPPAQLCCNFVGPMIQRVSQIRLSPC